MNDVQKDWLAHLASGFPAAARGRVVHGVDLVLVDTYAAGCIQSLVDRGALDVERTNALLGCVEELERAVPLLGADSVEYFSRLLAISRTVLARAGDGNRLYHGKTVQLFRHNEPGN